TSLTATATVRAVLPALRRAGVSTILGKLRNCCGRAIVPRVRGVFCRVRSAKQGRGRRPARPCFALRTRGYFIGMILVPTDPLQTPLIELPGAGPRLEALDRLGLRTVGDLLFHLPRAYEDLTDLRPISALTAGATCTVQGEIIEMDTRHLADGRFVVSVVLCDDGTHVVEGVWFNQAHVTRRFRYGQRVSFSGKPKWFRDHW